MRSFLYFSIRRCVFNESSFFRGVLLFIRIKFVSPFLSRMPFFEKGAVVLFLLYESFILPCGELHATNKMRKIKMTSRKHFIFLNFICINFHTPLFNPLRSSLHSKRPIFLKMLYTVKRFTFKFCHLAKVLEILIMTINIIYFT